MTRFLLLMIALIMFPQVVETAYSPALPLIAQSYAVSASEAGQTLSVYFIAFALGVLFWGWLCDRAGRRPAVLTGLTVYGLGDYAFVSTADGQGIVFKEGHSVMLVFAANEQLQEGLTKTLKAVTGKAAKWRKGELVTFKASE